MRKIEETLGNRGGRERMVFVTNIPTPYRTNFFNKLAEECARLQIELVVLYCARTEWNRHWKFAAHENRYNFCFLRGVSVIIRSVTYHANPGIALAVRELMPTWLVLGGSWHMPTALLARIAVPKGTIKILWSEGHAGAVMNSGGPIAWVRRKVLSKFEMFAVPNQRSRDFIEQENGKKCDCVLLPNTVDDDFFIPAEARERDEARRQLRVPTGFRVFLQVSQLEARKGVAELLAVFDEVTKSYPRCMMVLIGAGSMEEEIRVRYQSAIAENRIKLMGAVGPVDVRRWLYASDVVMLVSKRDPNPLIAIEAALCGRPLIMTEAVGNVGELVLDGVSGYVVKDSSESSIRLVVEEVMRRSSAELEEMGRVCGSRAKVGFSTRMVAGQFVSAMVEARAKLRPTRGLA